MEYRIMIQSTPNPNALKFVVNTPVKSAGNATFKAKEDAEICLLAQKLFDVSADISEVYLFDNYITVTQNGNGDWDDLEDKIKATILENVASHNPDFELQEAPKAKEPAEMTPEMVKINSILDQTVRPALQMDGGDLQVLDYKDNILYINYQGACGSCPSASMGTMKAIENLLKEEFNPEIIVEQA